MTLEGDVAGPLLEIAGRSTSDIDGEKIASRHDITAVRRISHDGNYVLRVLHPGLTKVMCSVSWVGRENTDWVDSYEVIITQYLAKFSA